MRRPASTLGRALIVVFFVALCAGTSAVLYETTGQSRVTARPDPVSDGVNILLEAADFDADYNEATLRIELVPVGSYFNDPADEFAVHLQMTTKNVIEGPVVRDIPAGTAVGKDYELVYPVEGDSSRYPLDHYRYSYHYTKDGQSTVSAPLVRIERVTDSGEEPVPVGLAAGPSDILEGWSDHWDLSVDGSTLKTTLVLERSGALRAFVGLILILMAVVANLAVLVAWSSFTGRRPVEPGYASWLAALLFALIPLRVNLPGAPPIGAWIDAVVFFWVEVMLLFSMALFIAAWFRYRDVPDYSELEAARAARRR